MHRYAATALAAITAVFAGRTKAQGNNSTNTYSPSIFVSPNQNLVFGITLPEDAADQDIYFAISAPTEVMWAGIGLGQTQMPNSLFLIIYPSSSGKNVTLSTRLSTSNSEPVYTSEIQVESLTGTGVSDGAMTFAGRCANCRSWAGGSIDPSSAAQDCIFAVGQLGQSNSDDLAAPLKFHLDYGSFAIDLQGAKAPAGTALVLPPLDQAITSSNSSGATLLSDTGGAEDWISISHAVTMVACFVALLPLGIILLLIAHRPRWHGVCQFIGILFMVTGAALGIYDSFWYNRSKKFNSAHQVIGMVVVGVVIIQFSLGFSHRLIFKKTQKPPRLSPVHKWIGWLVVPMGIINAFIGFPFALGSDYDVILAVLVLAIIIAIGVLLSCRLLFRRRRNKDGTEIDPDSAYRGGYVSEPWLQHQQPPPPPQPAGLGAADPAPAYSLEDLSYRQRQAGPEPKAGYYHPRPTEVHVDGVPQETRAYL